MATENAEASANSISKWEKYIISLFIVASMLVASMGYSYPDPIYPPEAAKKEIPASQFGFVLGVFQLAYILSSPVYGVYAKSIGPTLLFRIGLLILSLSTISFGFLKWLPNGASFLAMSVVVRIINGMSDSAVCISGYILANAYYPTDATFAVSMVHTSYVVGATIAPPIGSTLYGIGGFYLPFLISGGILLLLCFISIFVLKSISYADNVRASDGLKIANIIQNPRVIIACFAVFTTTTSSTFILTLLEVHISQVVPSSNAYTLCMGMQLEEFILVPPITCKTILSLTDSSLGLVFMALLGAYIISTLIWGRLTNKIDQLNIAIICGLVTSAAGLLLIGPAPFIPLHLSVPLVVTSLILKGLGYGCILICVFGELLNIIAGDGPKDLATKGYVSGLFSTMMSIGCFVGPTVSGPLYDLIGFEFTSMIMFGLELLAAVLIFMVVLSKCAQNKGRQEETSDV